MTAFPKYPSYKPSGVEWLDDVPEHWEVLPGRTCLLLNKDKNCGNQITTVLSLSYGRVVIKPPEKLTGLVPASFEGYQIIQPGDVIIRPTDLQNDTTSLRVGLAKDGGIITSAYLGLRPVKKASSEYLYYLLHAYDLMKVYYGMGTGMRQSLDWRDFKYLNLCLPPRAEQDRIVAFLDEKTAEIDRLIAKKQRQIELLDEQKAILINRVVTRGLHPQAELQDSGIPWIGPIPKGWEVSRLKHECSHIVDCPHATPVYEPDGEFPAIRTSDVSPGETHHEQAKRVGPKEFARWTERLFPRPGDILYSREGDWGISAPVPEGVTLCISQRMMIFRPKESVNSSFLMWQLNCEHILRQGFLDVLGSTVPHVNIGTIANYRIVIPPKAEQEAIAKYIQAAHEAFKATAAKIKSQIQTLQTLRSTLIAHAVTGKIKV